MGKATVKFNDGAIYLNGSIVGYLEGRGEIYVTFINEKGGRSPVARFKHARPGLNAKAWVKHVLTHNTVAQIIETLAWDTKNPTITPAEFARRTGHKSPNELRAEQFKAEAEARKSQITADAARRAGYPVIDLSLAKVEPSAFVGEIKTLRYV